MAKTKNSVRMIDIAKRAGVSRIAVSQVLNPRPGSKVRVSNETAERVRFLAHEMGYLQDRIATQLSGGSSGLVGFVIDSNSYPVWTGCMAAAAEVLFPRNYRLQVGLQHDSLEQLRNHLDDFAGRRVDGVICASHTYRAFGAEIPELMMRFRNRVFIQQPVNDHRSSFVAPDINGGIRLLLDHLIRLGRCRIVLLSQPDIDYNTGKLHGFFTRHLIEHGLEPLICDAATAMPLDVESGVSELLDHALKLKPDALVAGSDYVAIWVMKLLKRRGIQVPDDLAVVSNQYTSIGQAWEPEITSINYHFELIGRKAGEIMLELMKQNDGDTRIIEHYIAPELVIGRSCGY